MPRYCVFDEPVKLHRVNSSLTLQTPSVGVRLRYSDMHNLKYNISRVQFSNVRAVISMSDDRDTWRWCTPDEYEESWHYIANELARMSLPHHRSVLLDCDTPNVIDISDMPKYSMGIDKYLNVITRDTSGVWLYVVKNDDGSLAMHSSTTPPDGKVVLRPAEDITNDESRIATNDRYWVITYRGYHTLVAPLDGQYEVPQGSIANSRFAYLGKNGCMLPFGGSQEFIVDNEERYVGTSGHGAIYGELIPCHDDTQNYYIVDMTYPNVFGFKGRKILKMHHMSAFTNTKSVFCSDARYYLRLSVDRDERYDCLTGERLRDDRDISELMPAYERNVNEYFTSITETNGWYANTMRIMHIDEYENKTYEYLPMTMAFTAMSTFPFSSYGGQNFLYNKTRYVWDGRNKAWINGDDAISVPFDYRRDCEDIFTHRKTTDTHICPICGKEYAWGTRSTLHYIVDGVHKYVNLCQNCVDYIDNGADLTIKDEDGYSFVVNINTVRYSSGSYIKNDAFCQNASDDTYGLLTNYATWDSETKTWVPNDDAWRLVQSDDGTWAMTETYCTHVHGYSYKPVPVFNKEEDDTTNKYLGVELELMDGGENDRNARSICKDFEELYAKHDGSLRNGLELVSHPCTIQWHMKHMWNTVLERARTLSYVASSGSGIHVHVSKRFWDSCNKRAWITNLIVFCDMNRNALRRYANRSTQMFSRWTEAYTDSDKVADIVKVTRDSYGDVDGLTKLFSHYSNMSDHYKIVNLDNCSTVEIRMFASTTDYDRLKSILQFVDVITDLSLVSDLGNPITFKRIKELATTKGYNELLTDTHFISAFEYAESHSAH